MKKLVIAALAIGAMASCTKSTVQYEQSGEISLQPVTQKATKAAIDGNTYPDTEHFKVWAWWDESTPSNSPTYTNYADDPYIVAGEFAPSGGNWAGWDPQKNEHAPYYWPTSGSLVFAGYSPAEAIVGQTATFSYDIDTQTFKVEDYIQSNNISLTKDLMWADVSESYLGNGETRIPLTFKHALSWLTFKFYLKESTTPEYWTIKSVVLKGIETTADFTASTTNIAWTIPTDAPTQEITVYNNTTGQLVKKTYDPADAAILENTHNGVLIIPQSCAPSNGTNPADAELVITYDLKSPTGQTLTNQNVSLPLNGANINENKWELGKHYIYTITFGGNEILISPTVTDWTEPDVNQNIQVQ